MTRTDRRALLSRTADALARWTTDLSEWRILHSVAPALEIWFGDRDDAHEAGRELAALGWEWTTYQSEQTGRWRIVAAWKGEA